MTFREVISKKIQENRPRLSPSSLKTYVSILVNLHKRLAKTTDSDKDNLDWFHQCKDEILDSLKDIPSRSRKSVLSACFVLTGIDDYRKLMIDDCKQVNEDYKNQKMDTKEKENWIEISAILEKYETLKKDVVGMLSHKKIPHVQTIVEFFLLAFLGGVSGLVPRRSMDFSLLKIRNYDPKTDNYYKAGKLYFNQYKTASRYGLQSLDVPPELNKLIKKWIKMNKNDYMLVSSNQNPLSSSQISRILNKIFDGKKISTDMLRHIYLTHIYKDIPALRQMEQLAADMGHSLNQQMLYVKKE